MIDVAPKNDFGAALRLGNENMGVDDGAPACATSPNLDNNEAPLDCPLESGFFCSDCATGLGSKNSGVVGAAGTGLVTGALAPKDPGITNGLGLGFCSPDFASSTGLIGSINGVAPGLNEHDGVEVVAAAGNRGAVLVVEVAGFSPGALKPKGEG